MSFQRSRARDRASACFRGAATTRTTGARAAGAATRGAASATAHAASKPALHASTHVKQHVGLPSRARSNSVLAERRRTWQRCLTNGRKGSRRAVAQGVDVGRQGAREASGKIFHLGAVMSGRRCCDQCGGPRARRLPRVTSRGPRGTFLRSWRRHKLAAGERLRWWRARHHRAYMA